MIYFVILTAFTVSIDSFFCGFSLSYASKKKTIVLGIGITVFIMCLVANYFALAFNGIFTENTASLGGIILVIIGIYNLFKKDTERTVAKTALGECIATGFAVGLDGAMANLSLSIMGLNSFLVPLTIAVMHAIMIALGIAFAQNKFTKKLKKASFIPPLVLILLGVYKLSALFI